MNDRPTHSPKTIVWWAIWFTALLEAVLAYLIFSPADQHQGNVPADFSGVMIALFMVGVSVLLRWGVLGFVRRRRLIFVLFVSGVALSVVAVHLSLFSDGPFGRHLFAVSVLGILQFVPLFARQSSES